MIIPYFSPSSAQMRWVLISISLLTLSACEDNDGGGSALPSPEVSVAEVVIKPITQWDEYNGRIEAIESVDLRPRVSGYIERVAYREGDEVNKDDVLFTIDPRSYRADLARAQAQLTRARSEASRSKSEAARARTLVEYQAISTEIWEQRRSADESAQAEVQSAQAAVDTAKLNLEWTQVRSPINGRASRARFTAGNLVTVGDASSVLTTIVSQEKVYVYFDADEKAFLRYTRMARSGERPSERGGLLPVHIALADETNFPHEGTVDFVDNRVDRGSGTIVVRAVLDNKDRVFTPGLYTRVRLVGSGEFQAVLINDKAVLTDQDRKYVYIVDKNGLAQRRDVLLGNLSGGLRIVREGLAAGDRVIVSGTQKVFFPGMPVKAAAVPMPQPGAPVTAAK